MLIGNSRLGAKFLKEEIVICIQSCRGKKGPRKSSQPLLPLSSIIFLYIMLPSWFICFLVFLYGYLRYFSCKVDTHTLVFLSPACLRNPFYREHFFLNFDNVPSFLRPEEIIVKQFRISQKREDRGKTGKERKKKNLPKVHRINAGNNMKENFLVLISFSPIPWWLSRKETACQCRRHGFDSQVGKIP